MRMQLVLVFCFVAAIGMAQTQPKIMPRVTRIAVEDGTVTELQLAPGYTTSVRLPAEVSSVVIGNPTSFKAEHSEAEARLVFFKPTTSEPSQTNALITMKCGKEISLHLISAGKAAVDAPVDFLIDYRRSPDMLIASNTPTFLIAETRPILSTGNTAPAAQPERVDPLAKVLERQKSLSAPAWVGKELLIAPGDSLEQDHETVFPFSVLNSSNRIIELLPPQLELTGTTHGHGGKRLKAEPIPVSEYRLTARHLEPGQRADGVIVFQRPAFKESTDQLQLQLAEADQVDRPISLPIPFITSSQGGAQ